MKKEIKLLLTKEWLQEKYWNDEFSIKDISKMIGVCPQTILNYMKKFMISRRSVKNTTNRTREKLSNSHLGSKNPMFGKKRPEHAKIMRQKMKSRKISTETKIKMSLAKIGITGENHNRWVGPEDRKGTLNKNIRNLFEMKTWKEKVFIRDGNICQICKKSFDKNELQIDHIIPLHFLITKYKITNSAEAKTIKDFWDINNGRVLCVRCHVNTDTFGTKVRKCNGHK